ncbi:histone deacetylase family protein [Thalassospira sp. GB04J01]|uniref:histone deacetylase family protein n=1 Tax=Thalassospira sp. GB04J01 TaxID=1485225 RepID=UPI000C9AC52E|nr:histone deacetylase family protein [Thalassospira sp. GB04J01]|tara:strand:- start:34683 stop:35735 length:1053 start_codon:yes stop_codon:yes gene_type:complete
MMHAYFSDDQLRHHGKTFIVAGERKPIPEVPERAEILSGAVSRLGLSLHAPRDFGMDPIAAIHDANYLTFLQTIYLQWQAAGGSELVIPNIHPFDRNGPYPRHHVGKAGFHLGDTSCPVSETTWYSAYASAQTAIAATRHVRDDGANTAYALCRPPGHHASSNIAGGFCYLNNSAIAAQELRAKYNRVAILDVDLHHGNGTQHIFYDRDDVMTLSIHADPSDFYPFFWGHAQERGEGAGVGFNHNDPLPLGSGDAAFLSALDRALAVMDDFNPGAVVIALGLDASRDDPFGGLTVSPDGFAKIGEKIGTLKCPTVLVQEGGYVSNTLAENLYQFISAFRTTNDKNAPKNA